MAFVNERQGVHGVYGPQGDMIAPWHLNLLAPIQEDARLLPLDMGGVVLNSGGPEAWLSAFSPGALERRLERLSSGVGRRGAGGLGDAEGRIDDMPPEEQFPMSPADEQFPMSPADEQFPMSPADEQFPMSPADEQFPMSPADEQFPMSPADEQLCWGCVDPRELETQRLQAEADRDPARAAYLASRATQAAPAPSRYVQRTVQPTQAQAPAAQQAAAPAGESALSVIGKILGGVNQGAQAFLGKKSTTPAPAASGSSVIPVVIGVVAAGAIAYALGRATS